MKIGTRILTCSANMVSRLQPRDSVMIRLVAATASGPLAVIFSASAIAASSTFPGSARTLTSPSSWARCGRQVVTGQRQLHGDRVRDALRQPQQSPTAGHQSSFDLGDAERRVPGRDDQVGGQRQLGAAGQGVPLHRRDQRLGRRTFGEAHAAALDDDVLAAGERLEVHARAERAARAGQDPHRKAGIAVEPIHGVGQAPADGGVDRVLGLRPVDRNDQNPVPLFDQDFGFGVASFFAHSVRS